VIESICEQEKAPSQNHPAKTTRIEVHRHFMGSVEPVEFKSYSALLERFIREVHELWRMEDEEGKS
jgi:hypothetical protein